MGLALSSMNVWEFGVILLYFKPKYYLELTTFDVGPVRNEICSKYIVVLISMVSLFPTITRERGLHHR